MARFLSVLTTLLLLSLVSGAAHAASSTYAYDGVVTSSFGNGAWSDYSQNVAPVGTPFVVSVTYDLQGSNVSSLPNSTSTLYFYAVDEMSFRLGGGALTEVADVDGFSIGNRLYISDQGAREYVTFGLGSSPLAQGRLSFIADGADFIKTPTALPDMSLLPGATSGTFSYGQPLVFGFQGQITGLHTIPAVPEPSTYAMMALGLGAMGAMARRRRRST